MQARLGKAARAASDGRYRALGGLLRGVAPLDCRRRPSRCASSLVFSASSSSRWLSIAFSRMISTDGSSAKDDTLDSPPVSSPSSSSLDAGLYAMADGVWVSAVPDKVRGDDG